MAALPESTVCAISAKMWSVKSEWNSLLQECYEFALPDRNPYFGNGTGKPTDPQPTQGKDKSSRRVYDSSLAIAATRLANRLQYELFPIGSKWANFTPGPFVVEKQQSAALRVELEKLREVIFTAIALSNFDLSIAEFLLELVVAGTACMLVQQGDDDNPLIYTAATQSSVAIREGVHGKIDFITRLHRMRHSLIEQTWTDAKVPPVAKTKAEDDPEMDLVEATYWDNKDKIWRYEIILKGGDGNGKKEYRILARVYKINPWVIARWSKAAGEDQGRSLVMLALPDARVLSSVKSYLLRHAALAIGGVWMVRNDGIINANNVRIFPGATIPVRATGGSNGASIAPLQAQGDVNLAQLVIQDLVTSIKKIMMDDAMPEIRDGVRTATEWLERLRDLQQSMGAPFSRVLREGIIPMLEATIQVLAKAGSIPVDPENPIKLNNGQVNVAFQSPLVQGQSMRDVEVLQQSAAVTGAVAGPQAVQLSFKVEDVGAWVGGKLGVDPVLIRTPDERAKLQQNVATVLAAQGGGMVAPGASVGPAPQQQPQAMAA
jgi:hypothetical protein